MQIVAGTLWHVAASTAWHVEAGTVLHIAASTVQHTRPGNGGEQHQLCRATLQLAQKTMHVAASTVWHVAVGAVERVAASMVCHVAASTGQLVAASTPWRSIGHVTQRRWPGGRVFVAE